MKRIIAILLIAGIIYMPGSWAGLEHIHQQPAITTIFASQPGQPGFELNELNHGVFTWALLQSLSTQHESTKSISSLLEKTAKIVTDKTANKQRIQIISDGKQLDAPLCAKGKTRLLSIGINQYQDKQIRDIQYAVDDIKAIAKRLNKHCKDVKQTTLIDQQATRKNILQRLADILQQSKPEDRVIINISGLGMNVAGNNYLIPSDANYTADKYAFLSSALDTSELIRQLQQSRTGSGLLLLDIGLPQIDQITLR